MLNKAPNNNDITLVDNMVLNKAANSNNATLPVANNVCLTTMGTQQFSMVAIYIANIMQKSRLIRDKR